MPKIENESGEPAEDRTDENRMVSAVAAASRVGGLVASNLAAGYIGGGYGRKLDRLPQAIRDGMLIHGVLAHLIGHELLAPTSALMDDEMWLPLDLPDGLRELFEVALDTSVERQARIDAQAQQMLAGRPPVRHGRDGWPQDVTLADGVDERPR